MMQQKRWAEGELNPQSSGLESDALPLRHPPMMIAALWNSLIHVSSHTHCAPQTQLFIFCWNYWSIQMFTQCFVIFLGWACLPQCWCGCSRVYCHLLIVMYLWSSVLHPVMLLSDYAGQLATRIGTSNELHHSDNYADSTSLTTYFHCCLFVREVI